MNIKTILICFLIDGAFEEKKPSTSRRKSVSASAVPQKITKSPTSKKQDESKMSRSRSQSSSTKVLDVMFTPVKVKG